MDRAAVLETIRGRVVPSEAEREALATAVEELTARAEAAIETLPVEADTVLVGSTARGTWLAGDRDIDLFVRFPPSLPREDLERYGLDVGYAVLPDGHEEYAEHPYVKGSIDGFDVDCVPCYAVEDATQIRSAVDRTPFHSAYLEGAIEPLADDVRIAKAFLRGIGAYGSNLRTEGFSGFLTELLVLEYGGFLELLEAAADWSTPVEIDPEDHGRRTFDDPLVVVDPTDPERNVAAVCSATNVARLQHYARAFLSSPSTESFETTDPEPLSRADVRSQIDGRGTTPLAVRFSTPDLVEDQLYPQLAKSLDSIVDSLVRGGFEPIRADRFAEPDGSAALFVECAVAELPAIERHTGPPVDVRVHAEGFYDAYESTDVVGPFIDGDRYVVERSREHRTPEEWLEASLFDVSLGPHVETALRTDHDLLVGPAVTELADAFGAELARYFDPRP